VTAKERLDRHDRQIAAIRALVNEGMRLVVDTRKDMRELVAIQKHTEQKLEALINTMRRGTNGHTRKKIDLQ
jgi:DNA-binding FrmR family transcriptional regulator